MFKRSSKFFNVLESIWIWRNALFPRTQSIFSDVSFDWGASRLLPTPRTRSSNSRTTQHHGVCSFLGISNVLKRFAPSFADIAVALNRKLQQDQLMQFGPLNKGELNEMKNLQEKLVCPSNLRLSCGGDYYKLETDACNVRVGYVLLKKLPDSTKWPIYCWYWSMKKAKQAITATQRECLAIMWSILLLRSNFKGTRFIIQTH